MELHVLLGFIIGGHILNNIICTAAIGIMVDRRKLQEILDTALKDSRKKGLTTNGNKTECMVVRKGNSPGCDLQIGEIIIKQIQRF